MDKIGAVPGIHQLRDVGGEKSSLFHKYLHYRMFPYVQFVPIAISIVILLCRRGSAAGHAQDGGGHHSQRAREERSQEDAR